MSEPELTQTRDAKEPSGKRRVFIDHLHQLYRSLDSGNRHVAAPARRELAVLRRGLVDAHEMDAYQRVLDFEPPEREQRVWLLVGALFALHPQRRSVDGAWKPSVGSAMGRLARDRDGAVKRRFRQLASVEGAALEHHVRQGVQLLRGSSAPLDYETLLDDLVTLLADDPHGHHQDDRRRVRLRWARDFHRAASRSAGTHDSQEDE